MSLKFSNSPLGRFRKVALAEGISFILLLMAMPFKYLYDMPQGVKIVGWIHGFLFILYMIMLLNVKLSNKWSVTKSLIAFLASLIPFGTFVLDRSLRKEEQRQVVV